MSDLASNGSPDDLLSLVTDAARELSRHDDPAAVMRLAQKHGRRIIRFDRSLAASRRELPAPQIRITRIPIEARIVHLADVYDALVSPRVYKQAWTQRQAAEFIVEAAGQMFDPELV
ncbi:MAG: HD domain-containing phosphohydrolase, partial [Tepidisphaeraceae bacterium]